MDPVKNKSNFLQKVGFFTSSNFAKKGANPTANPTGISGCFILYQKVRKTPDSLSKSGVFMARRTGKDITGFLEKSACDKAFSDFFIFFAFSRCGRMSFLPFQLRTEKDICSNRCISHFQNRSYRVQKRGPIQTII